MLMLNKQQREIEKKLEEKRTALEELEKREEELEQAIEEAETEEEQEAVEEEVEAHEKSKEELEEEISKLEEQLADITAQKSELEEKEVERTTPVEPKVSEERRIQGGQQMEERKNFGGITRQQFNQYNEREEVKQFFTRMRSMKAEGRAVTGADLLIPEVFVGILRDNIHKYSKLLAKVWVRPVKGTSRVTLPGTIPEAVWTEACARLNELDINFNEVEVDGFKVGGYIPICNATLEDASDIDLYNEIMFMLAQAIGLAIDKAILYGTGSKMPLGVVTRLNQSAEPANYSPNARPWENLQSTNLLQAAGATGEELFADLIGKTAAAKGNYSDGVQTWCMNETTYRTIQAKLVTFNAAGVIVSSMNNTMPILGGDVVVLPFIPDGDIIGGYFKNYLLPERAGMRLGVSEHVQFIEDNTVFKGTARYDGLPVIAEAFVAINITGSAPTTSVAFAPDEANAVEEEPAA